MFLKIIADYEEYQNLSNEQKTTGQSIIKQIKSEVGERYKLFREKITSGKSYDNLNQEAIKLFNIKTNYSRSFRFSDTLLHSSLKIIDSKKIKIPDLPDNQHTLLALVEPSIGNKKNTIKFKM